MKKMGKLLSLLLSAAIIMSAALTGCGKEKADPQASSTSETGKQNSPEVKLKVYGIIWGNQYNDFQKVLDEANKRIKQKIDATIDFTIDLAAESDKKVPLMLASAEDYDGMAMNTAVFQTEVAKGGIREVGDMLNQYMPSRVKGASAYDLKDITYNGKLYGIPGAFQPFTPQGWIIRGDLRKKYNIPEVKDLDGLKSYLQILKEKEPNVIPYNTSAGDALTLNQAVISSKGYVNTNVFGTNLLGLWYPFNSDKVTVTYDHEMPEFKDFLTLTKEFTDKGYWSKNAYASKTISLTEFKAGTSFVGAGHVVAANDTATQLKISHPDWEVEFVRIPNNYRDRPSRGLAYAIPQSAKNPERLMMAMELIQTDAEINSLLEYGIKDVHYTLTSDGKLKPTEQGAKNFPVDAFPLIFTNKNRDFVKAVEGSVPNFLTFQHEDKIKEYSKENKLAGFVLNKDPISSEVAAITEVINTYKSIIYLGGFDDVGTAAKQFSDKMKAAGADKVKAEVQKQIDAFLAAKKK